MLALLKLFVIYIAIILSTISTGNACTFDSDCLDQCDGVSILPRGCNAVTSKCETIPAFKKNCSDTSLYKPFEFTANGNLHSVPQKCLLSATGAYCGNDKIIALKELSVECKIVRKQFDFYERDRLYLHRMAKEASIICKDHAANLMVNLVVTGAFAMVGAGSAGLAANGTSFFTISNQLIGEVTSQIVSKYLPPNVLNESSKGLKDLIKLLKPGKVKAYDFCTIQQRLYDDIIPVVEKTRDQFLQENRSCKAIEKTINIFPEPVIREIDIDLDPKKPDTKKPPKKPEDKSPPKKPEDKPVPEDKPNTQPKKKACKDLDKTSQEWIDNCKDKDQTIPVALVDLTMEFTCGDSFELSPNDVLIPKTCNVIVRNANDPSQRVEMEATYDERLIDVTFDNQSEVPKSPKNSFLLIIRTTVTAAVGETTMTITVRHAGQELSQDVTISILPPGLNASSGSGIRPPAIVATGSGGTYCVWRNKSFGDPPNCFNILTAPCDSPKYAGKSKYELVGSDMTWGEAENRSSALGRYHGNAYNCDPFVNSDEKVADKDKDSIPDKTDNCPNKANRNQLDSDSDGIGDVCDDDFDNDSIPDYKDNCPKDPNTDQKDRDYDGKGDVCDKDSDNDGILDHEDNCPYMSNPSQANLDNDKNGDACDTDIDGDGAANGIDNCPEISNKDQADIDADGIGDVCDVDRDGDGKRDGEDNCPNVYNPDQKNSDSHWMGDACWAPDTKDNVASADCSNYPGTKAVWDEESQSSGCICTGDKDWSDLLKRCATDKEVKLAGTNCSGYGKAIAVWDDATSQTMCECIKGYEFDVNNQCIANTIDPKCENFPGTVFVNNNCECPGVLEWSQVQGMCVSNANLTANDVDCTAYPGSFPQWDNAQNSWGCECIGNKKWSSTLNACAHPEDEAVAATDCSTYAGTTAVYDDFVGSVVCKCINSGLILSNSQSSCMSAQDASVADLDCSSFGSGATSYFNTATKKADCQCTGNTKLNSAGIACETIVAATSPQPTGQGQLPVPTIIKPGVCDVLYDKGGNKPESYVFQVANHSNISLFYDTYNVKDNISVLTSSRSLLWSSGCVGQKNTQSISLPPGSQEIIIDVHPNCSGTKGTGWKFKASCQ